MYNILVVDDQKEIVDILDRYYSKKGYKIIPVTASDKAVSYLETLVEEIHLLITDIKMPGVFGFELLKIAKKKNIPAIIITGLPKDDILSDIKELGYNMGDIVYKPISFELLSKLMKIKLPKQNLFKSILSNLISKMNK